MVDIDGPNIYTSNLDNETGIMPYNSCDEEHFFFSPLSLTSKIWFKDENNIAESVFGKNYMPYIKKIHIL